ncbi:MAG: hypothetical protein CVU40_12675 [Chloroflexi bacterium HGW-Chloroflexi-2]|jgi:hypothetical protein|nr:MAG: hypothetical protein CVU40_12675 [Chloroflexi bacterium HGW-Chloroflexi-2]
MDKPFIDTLMDYIMEGTMIPKSQIERAVGPILSMFLDVVLSETFREDKKLSGSLKLVCPEFPLKKKDNWQSTNIDWLMYNKDRKQLLFVELKTSDTSINDDQNSIYHIKQEAILHNGGAFLIEDLEQMRDRSSEFGKYQYILETKVLPLKDEISNCHDAKIIYLVPKSAEHKVKGHADSILTFAMLSKSIPGKFAEEWGIIRDHLCALDDSSQRSRNRQYRISAPQRDVMKSATSDVEISPITKKSVHWQGTVDFHEMFNLCLEHGDNIIVGFTGGIERFSSSTFTEIQLRRFYRWDFAKNLTGKKKADWLAGSTIIEILRQHHGYPSTRQ